jgi:hypothetical protein
MAIARGKLRAMELPSYKWKAASSDNVFDAHDWSGVPKTTTPYLTPIIHRGYALAMQRYDPEQTDPIPNYPSHINCPARFRQYGSGWGVDNRLKRAPTLIVFNNDLAVGRDVTTPASSVAPNVGMDTSEDILEGISSELDDAHVFTAGFHTDQILDFYSFGLPAHGTETVTLDGRLWVDTQIDPDSFVGGNLLILYAGYTYQGTSSFSYYYDQSGFTAVERPQTIANQKAKVAACLDRFNVFRQYVYIREAAVTPTDQLRADPVTAAYLAMAGDAATVNVTIRGKYLWSESIASQVQADVRSFLAEVEAS